MCAVSAITDYGMQRWPDYRTFPPVDYSQYMELLEKARKYDELTKQPDCPDPAKVEWQTQLAQYMREQYGLEPKKT